jgi:stage III sporulation protein AG
MQQERKNGFWQKYISKWNIKSTGIYLVYGVLFLLALALYVVGSEAWRGKKEKATDKIEYENAMEQHDKLEQKLSNILSSIRGAGNVQVLITYETGTEIVPAMSVNSDESIRDSITNGENNTQRSVHTVTEPATIQGSGTQAPIILVEKEPTIRGVVIVAQGAADISVRLQLQRAVRAVTGISEDKIEVFEMTGEPLYE